MHSSPFFLTDVAGFLGGYYAFIAGMNGVFAYLLWQKYGQTGRALVWTVFAGAMMILASLALSGAAAWVPALPASSPLKPSASMHHTTASPWSVTSPRRRTRAWPFPTC